VSGRRDLEYAVAILDVRKKYTRLLIVDAASGELVRQLERPSVSLAGDLGPQLDVLGIEDWLHLRLATMPERSRLRAVVPIAHGAAAVLLDRSGSVLAALDYDNPAFDAVADQYRALRDDFSATFSPFLNHGRNLGRQLYWLNVRAPEVMKRCHQILTYPQYWAWRLSGVAACEWTSLGCHTDLWLPPERKPSPLAVNHGWAERLAPVRSAGETLGSLRSEWARLSGLDPACRVICGMHDASAAYLAPVHGRTAGTPFATIASGNWTVLMASGIDLTRLVEFRDMLGNVDIAGQPVGTARFAGGREYRVIAGPDAAELPADEAALLPLLRSKAMAIPCFVSRGGAYAGRPGKLIGAEQLSAQGRVALASVYVALMTDLLLDWLDAKGDILLDGMLCDNAIYTRALASLRPRQKVKRSNDRQAILYAGIQLAGYPLKRPMMRVMPAPTATVDALDDYRRQWRRQLPRISL
jgi:sugar (pentulose or hexulose) kinase